MKVGDVVIVYGASAAVKVLGEYNCGSLCYTYPNDRTIATVTNMDTKTLCLNMLNPTGEITTRWWVYTRQCVPASLSLLIQHMLRGQVSLAKVILLVKENKYA